MRKELIIVGLFIAALSVSVTAVQLTPDSREACCGIAKYTVTINNQDAFYQRAFKLDAYSPDSEHITVTLQPDLVIVTPKGSVELVMFVKPDCDTPAGQYKIVVDSECSSCDISEEAIAYLTVPEGCVEETTPPVVEIPEIPEETGEVENTGANATAEHTAKTAPTGAAVTTDEPLFIGIILILMVIIALLFILLARK